VFKHDFKIIFSSTAAIPGFPQAGGFSQGSRAGAHWTGAIPPPQPGAGQAGGQPGQPQPQASGTSLRTGAMTPSQQDRVVAGISRNKARQRHGSSGQGKCLDSSAAPEDRKGERLHFFPTLSQLFLLPLFPKSLPQSHIISELALCAG